MDTDANPSNSDYVKDDVKDIIRQYHPVCVALQKTFLKSCHTTKIRRYGCVRKDMEGPSVSGGVCIFTSLAVPSSALPLHTSLQAVAVRIHSKSLITVCCHYLPPNAVIHQQDLNNLVDQLPAPFVILAVRYFNVRIGHSSSHKFMQDQGVPQGSVLSVTLFNIHMSSILHHLPPSVRGMLYVDDLQVSCQSSDMRLIERQLQTTVNRLVKWCDQNGHTISPSKSSCVHFCRKRNLHPDPSIHIGNIQIPVVSEGADRVSLLRVYEALILSRLDYGCVVYGSARASVLKRLDTIHHSALRLCSGAFRTSPVTSLYVVCHKPPLELRRRQLSANYFIRTMSVPSYPLKPFSLATGLTRLYEARSFNIKPFSERAKAADTAARSMSDHMQWPVCCQNLKTSAKNYIHRVWQETWDQQILNKLHNIHPSTSHWAALPVRRHDVRLTRLRIGHTRFTHRHLLLELLVHSHDSCKKASQAERGPSVRQLWRNSQTRNEEKS
ncbi:putative RNA-directed DNA polymerase from transposon X-element [Trichonephila clavipes]|nr:putative RNA-directed DNA polymerase from transposon X-element [Trichonephila clavipes]